MDELILDMTVTSLSRWVALPLCFVVGAPRVSRGKHRIKSTDFSVQMSGAPGPDKSTVARLLWPSIGGIIIDHDVLSSTRLKSVVRAGHP